jgi:hypothetical protein
MTSISRIRVGVSNYYEELNRDGYMFRNDEASIGAGLLKPWRRLFEIGRQHSIDFFTLDQVENYSSLDAILFIDRPKADNALVNTLMELSIPKYLLLYECEVIKPDNWDYLYHQNFMRIFTWHDGYVDGTRYLKINFAIDRNVSVVGPSQRKFATLIAGAKLSTHPKELYSSRIQTIRWMEKNAPEDFEFYGQGWPSEVFPSYRGAVNDKLSTLANFNFAFCYENATAIPGYITEKILDCFLAGTIPIYKGAPNVSQWIPADCYINGESFDNIEDLYNFLKSFDDSSLRVYRSRIRDFLVGRNSRPYSIECFVDTLLCTFQHDLRNNTKGNLIQIPKSLEIVNAIDESSEKKNQRTIVASHHPQLVVYLGFGSELPVFLRARELWQFYRAQFPNVDISFVRTCKSIPRGSVKSDGYDLLVGIGSGACAESNDSILPGYRDAGVWSKSENAEQIFRQMAIFEYFLKERSGPFYLYHSTITSVVDFRGLIKALEHMPNHGCLAGMPGRLTSPPNLAGLNFICGTNSLFSSDVMSKLLDRYDPHNVAAQLPNDIWQALLLPDVPRRCLPFFTFGEPRKLPLDSNEITRMTQQLIAQGHFHFRIKTTSEQEGLGLREAVDPWIMAQIMQGVACSAAESGAVSRLIESLIVSTSPVNGITLNSNDEVNFFSGPRHFPLNDAEAKVLFR